MLTNSAEDDAILMEFSGCDKKERLDRGAQRGVGEGEPEIPARRKGKIEEGISEKADSTGLDTRIETRNVDSVQKRIQRWD